MLPHLILTTTLKRNADATYIFVSYLSISLQKADRIRLTVDVMICPRSFIQLNLNHTDLLKTYYMAGIVM